ncbi:MAG: TlpA family protein disulfide reductase, partial [Nitrososphaerales archaeon]
MEFRNKVGLLVAIAAIVGSILLIENPFAIQAVETAGRASDFSVGTDLGQRLPNFNLETIDGEKVSLSDYRGKVVFVNFWATWCPFCVDEIPDLERAFEEYGGDVAILGINRAESLQKQTGFLSDL